MARKKKPVDETDERVIPLSDLQAGDIFHLGHDSYRVRSEKADGSYIVVRLQQIPVNKGQGVVETAVIGVEILTLPGDTEVIEP